MIQSIDIKNFKSINNLKLDVGRINLFIGENGSGKSNFLEALVFVSASQTNKLDNEFLSSRGIRVTNPTFMRSAFEKENDNKDITIEITTKKVSTKFTFYHDNMEYSSWHWIFSDKDSSDIDMIAKRMFQKLDPITKKLLLDALISKKTKDTRDIINSYAIDNKIIAELKNFLIYSPENTALRIFEKEGQILPLGINGEGLLKLLKVINNYDDKSYIKKIIESLKLFSWFENITIPNNNENNIIIKDKYLCEEFDQKSSNEGFLFILFYITLVVAKETPKAFAIDNIDASLNPKLCTKLMTILAKLSKTYKKQIFLTTHNPAILDGIDLNDENQKLFVVSRNKLGHTRIKNIPVEDKPKSSTNEPVKLSEAFLRGYLGGLPKGF